MGSPEIWFDNVEDFREAFSSATYTANIRPDELKFMDLEHSVDLVAEENHIWPEQPVSAEEFGF